jgi:hypothetical protein
MSRRISSRDDLFLSALDLYTLLSLAFIGFAFFISPSSDSETIDLPIAQEGNETKASKQLTAQWVRGLAPKEGAGADLATCELQLQGELTGPGEQRRRFTIPCVPRAFGGQLPTPEALRLFQAGREPFREEVVILCSRRDGLFACASLQWLMHEAGFRPLTGVLPQR